MTSRNTDYSTITETPGDGISAEAAQMMRDRYHLVASMAAGRDVLEVCCGAGQGLGYLHRVASRVVGVDITLSLLQRARAHYPAAIPLLQGDAHTLPFETASFDVVAIHEAIYYFRDADAAFREARRVLRPGGRLLISTINPEWADFNPSPFSVRYLTAAELSVELGAHFPTVEIAGAFPATAPGLKQQLLSAAKRIAVRYRLIPKTMKGKKWLKRLVFGNLVPVPAELEPVDSSVPSVSLTGRPQAAGNYKVIYAIAEC